MSEKTRVPRMVCRNLVHLPLAAALTISACQDVAGPSALRGTHVLASIDGVGPPLITVDHTFTTGQRIMSRVVHDSLTFTSDTTIQRSELIETTYFEADGSTSGPLQGGAGYPGRFERQGEQLIVVWNSPLDPTLNRTDTFDIREGRISRVRLIGLACEEGCPDPRPAVFEYQRR